MTLLAAAQDGAAAAQDQIDLSGLWEQKWSEIAPGNEPLLDAMGLIGLAVLVGALMMWIWRRNQGQSQALGTLWPAMAIGAILSAPSVMLPVLLNVIDIVINMVVGFVQSV